MKRKALAGILTLAMALSLSLPALATEEQEVLYGPPEVSSTEEDIMPISEDYDDYDNQISDYDKGYSAAYDDAYDKGYAAGYANGASGKCAPLPEEEYADGMDTYAQGQTDGAIYGYQTGYGLGYEAATGLDYWTSMVITRDGGTPGQINVQCNGKLLSFSGVTPCIRNSRTLVPVRPVAEALDAQVSYDGAAKTVTLQRGEQTVTLTIGSTDYTVTANGETQSKTMDAAPFITGGPGTYATLVPLRFVGEALGAEILWDGTYRTAVVADTAALVEQIDQNFTIYNSILQAQTAAQAKGQVQQVELSGQLGLYDEAGKKTEYPVALTANTYTKDTAVRVDLSLDVEAAVKALMQAMPELMDQTNVSLGALLRTDLSDIPMTFLLTPEGKGYVNLPILQLLVPDRGYTDNTWLALPETLFSGLTTGETATVGSLTAQQTAAICSSLPYEYYSSLLQEQANGTIFAFVADDKAQKSGNTYRWALDNSLLAGALGLEEETVAEYLGLTLSGTVTLSADGSSGSAQLSLQMKNDDLSAGAMDLTLSLRQTSRAATSLPSFNLPDTAEVK